VGAQVTAVEGCIHVEGEMTIFTAAELKPALVDSGAVTGIDLSQVTEFDTAGLQLLLAVLRMKVSLRAASHAVVEVLELNHQTHLLKPAP
jgi:anti-anti-sigma regulatory factor